MEYGVIMNAKEIVKRLKTSEQGQKMNVTFRLPKILLKEFEEACKRQGVKRGAVVEELLREFISNLK